MTADLDVCLAETRPAYTIDRYGRHWQVLDALGQIVCVTVYKRGALEVVRRLRGVQTPPRTLRDGPHAADVTIQDRIGGPI